jgi:hypothetical protein
MVRPSDNSVDPLLHAYITLSTGVGRLWQCRASLAAAPWRVSASKVSSYRLLAQIPGCVMSAQAPGTSPAIISAVRPLLDAIPRRPGTFRTDLIGREGR